MMMLDANRVDLSFAQFIRRFPRYETDENGDRVLEYVTEENVPIYSMESGNIMDYYSDVSLMQASVSESGGEAEAMEFGLSVGDYEAVLVYGRGEYPIKEGSLIWLDSPIEYEYNGEQVDVELPSGEVMKTRVPVKTSADYIVLKTPKSLNFQKAILKAVVK